MDLLDAYTNFLQQPYVSTNANGVTLRDIGNIDWYKPNQNTIKYELCAYNSWYILNKLTISKLKPVSNDMHLMTYLRVLS